ARQLGNEDLVWTRSCHDPRRLVHRHTPDVVSDELHLADVDADPQRKVVRARDATHRGGALQRAGGAVEGDQYPVPGGLHLTPAEALKPLAHRLEPSGKQVAPGPVAETGRKLGRADEVGE